MRTSRQLTEDAPDVSELTLVPYLDILMNLIIFMLLSLGGLASFGALAVRAPAGAGPGADAAPLIVAIADSGFVLRHGAEQDVALARRADGSWDFAGLTTELEGVKARWPEERRVVLEAAPGISYEVVVSTIDAARVAHDRRPLFPDVTLH